MPHRSVFSAQQEQWLLMFQQFDLSPLQKKIIVLGMNEREVSPADIYKAINTTDRNVYDREVTGLRKTNILFEIRTNVQSTRYARANRIAKAAIPRFKVQVPTVAAPPIRNRPKRRHDAARPTQSGLPRNRSFNPETTVYVSNLPYDITSSELTRLFATVGTPRLVHIPRRPRNGPAKGFAFVTFEEPGSAAKAIEVLNGTEFGARRIYVRTFEGDTRVKSAAAPRRN